MTPVDLMLSRLDGVRQVAGGYMARCPAHEDRDPSLSVTEGDDGRCLLLCRAGCATDDVRNATTPPTTWAELFPAPAAGNGNGNANETVAEYDYTDEAGTLLFQVVRRTGKRFSQRRPDGNGGWAYHLGPCAEKCKQARTPHAWLTGAVAPVLFNLPAVVEAVAQDVRVWIVEGEKDALALNRAGEVATCNPGGAGKWKPHYAEVLRGATVIVVADRDAPGRTHAAEVARSLQGVAAVVDLREAAVGKDASGHLAAGLAVDDFVLGNGNGEPPRDDGDPGPGEAPGDQHRIDPAVLHAIGAEYGLVGPEAWAMADKVAGRIVAERANGMARRLVREEALVRDADLDAIRVVTAADLAEMPRSPRVAVFGELVAEGHNATVVARWKVGKSTFVDNAAAAAAMGGMFLGRFEVPAPMRVVLFNYELDPEDMADRIGALALTAAARERLAVVNLRGRRLPLTTPTGRERVAGWLRDHGAELWIVDPFGAAYAAAGGESENDNAEVRRFLIAIDEIKRLAGCATAIVPVHSGRGEAVEGDEQGRGATVLEDWPDVRIMLTKDRDGRRFVRSEGRAWDLFESPLGYEPEHRLLSLDAGQVGMNRAQVRRTGAAAALVSALELEPGATTRRVRAILHDAGVTNNEAKDDALSQAKAAGLVHVHPGKGVAQEHYPGPVHGVDSPCTGGWKQ